MNTLKKFWRWATEFSFWTFMFWWGISAVIALIGCMAMLINADL